MPRSRPSHGGSPRTKSRSAVPPKTDLRPGPPAPRSIPAPVPVVARSLAIGSLGVALLGGSLLVPPPLGAQAVGGMLFSYRPHPGQRSSFDEGYRAHLEWHREKEDSLPWYGWDVIAGRRTGQFVDGTFGISFEALDRRVDPAGDAAHAGRSFADHARVTGQRAVRARRDLGTVTPLEDHAVAAPLAQVVTYTLAFGRQASFVDALRRVRRDAATDGLLPYTVYESVVGTPAPRFVMMVWRDGMASFDQPDRDPGEAVRRALSGEADPALRVESELWRLRPDLTLLPGRGAAPGGTAAPALLPMRPCNRSGMALRGSAFPGPGASWSTGEPPPRSRPTGTPFPDRATASRPSTSTGWPPPRTPGSTSSRSALHLTPGWRRGCASWGRIREAWRPVLFAARVDGTLLVRKLREEVLERPCPGGG